MAELPRPLTKALRLPPLCRTSYDAGRRYAISRHVYSVEGLVVDFDELMLTVPECSARAELGTTHFAMHYMAGLADQAAHLAAERGI